VRYVGIAALAATFWLLVATVRLIRVSAPERCVPTSVTPPADRAPQVQKVRPDDFDPFGIDPRPSPRENPISKAALITGLNGVRTRVAYCYQKYKVPGTAMVNVVIGKSGRVSSAQVTGKFSGTPTGACVEAAVETARFPRSDGFSTPYPFQLR